MGLYIPYAPRYPSCNNGGAGPVQGHALFLPVRDGSAFFLATGVFFVCFVFFFFFFIGGCCWDWGLHWNGIACARVRIAAAFGTGAAAITLAGGCLALAGGV